MRCGPRRKHPAAGEESEGAAAARIPVRARVTSAAWRESFTREVVGRHAPSLEPHHASSRPLCYRASQPRRQKYPSTTARVASSSAIPRARKGVQPPMWANEEGEVLAEEAGQEGQRHEHRRDDRELLHHAVEPVRDGREVDVHRAGEQVAVGVDQIADPDQVVVDVAEVALRRRPSCRARLRRRRRSTRTGRAAGTRPCACRRGDASSRRSRAAGHRPRAGRSRPRARRCGRRARRGVGKKLSTSPSTTA